MQFQQLTKQVMIEFIILRNNDSLNLLYQVYDCCILPINRSGLNPVRGHKEVPRSTGHIMVTTRYSDHQGSKLRQNVMRLYKQWHRPMSERFIKPPYSIYRAQPRSTRIVVAYPRPAFSATNRTNYVPTSFDQQIQVSQGHTSYKNKKIEIPRFMMVEALSW